MACSIVDKCRMFPPKWVKVHSAPERIQQSQIPFQAGKTEGQETHETEMKKNTLNSAAFFGGFAARAVLAALSPSNPTRHSWHPSYSLGSSRFA